MTVEDPLNAHAQTGWQTRPERNLKVSFDHTIAWVVLVVVAWAPFPFGSARSWAWSLLGFLIGFVLLVISIRNTIAPGTTGYLKQLRWPFAIGGLLVTWILFQCAPWNLLGIHHPLWDQAAEILHTPLNASLSVNREASFVRLFRLSTYAGFFFVAWQVGQRPEGASLIFRGLAITGAVYAIYGLNSAFGLIDFSRDASVLWFPKQTYRGDVTSTFINRNSYATFAGLSLLMTICALADLLMKHSDARSRATLLMSLFQILLSSGKWLLIAFIFTGAALLLSHSRGGLLATSVGIFTLVGSIALAPSLRGPWRYWFIGVVAFGAIVVFLIDGAGVVNRFANAAIEPDARSEIYDATYAAIRDNLLGTGLGTFEYIFPMYQSSYTPGMVVLAHNDYLENILELGIPGAVLLFSLLGYLAYHCARGIRIRRKDALYPCTAFAATILVGTHALVDFSLQMPAVAVTYAVILGIGVAQSVSSRGNAG